MDYNQKIHNKAKEIDNLHDAFAEVRDRLDVLRTLDLTAFDDRLGMSIMYIVDESIDVFNAIECKIATAQS